MVCSLLITNVNGYNCGGGDEDDEGRDVGGSGFDGDDGAGLHDDGGLSW